MFFENKHFAPTQPCVDFYRQRMFPNVLYFVCIKITINILHLRIVSRKTLDKVTRFLILIPAKSTSYFFAVFS